MKRFQYQARDKSGKAVKGKVEAATPYDAARLLRERGLVVIKLNPERQALQGIWEKITNRITLPDIALFTRMFATMVTSGLPITEALVIVRSQSNKGLNRALGQVLTDVEGGSSLASAFEKHPKVFSPVYIALVRAGEEGGVLDKILLRLADNIESQREFRSKVKGALIYPAVVIGGMIVVTTVMMIFVIPRLTSLYGEFQAELPIATKILISVSGGAQRFWWLFFLLIFGLVWGFILFSKTPLGRFRVDSWKLKIPIAGKLQKQILLAEMTRTLGLLVGAGIAILEGLHIVSDVVNNAVIAKALGGVSRQVEKGFSLSYSLSQSPEVFPPMLFQLVAVGEETGKLDEGLLKVATIFEQESAQSIKGLTAAIEPLIMVVLGVGVGFLVIAIILPIYNLTSQF